MRLTRPLGTLLAALLIASCGGGFASVPPSIGANASALASPTSTAPTASSPPAPSAKPTTQVPAISPTSASIAHVIVVWMENKEASQITASSMPYLYGLSQTYGRAEAMFGVAHPSLPNYLAFWSGSTQGITDDASHDLTAANLSSQLSGAGKEWRVYAQNVPGNCFTGASASGGSDGPGAAGTYARKHEPAISFRSVSGDPTQCAKIQPLASFDPTIASVAFVVPNLCNDLHDCPLATGDSFLQAFLPSVLNSPDWGHTLLIVTFDEGTSKASGGGGVFTLVARQGLAGVVSSTMHTHYGVLRTIEDLVGLPCLESACAATPLTEFLARN